MIFRAIFWIGVVALLMPHEPDVGFGRPVAIDAPVGPELAGWAKTKLQANLKDPANLCRYNVHACASGITILDSVKSVAMRSLADVKADIARNGHGHPQAPGG